MPRRNPDDPPYDEDGRPNFPRHALLDAARSEGSVTVRSAAEVLAGPHDVRRQEFRAAGKAIKELVDGGWFAQSGQGEWSPTEKGRREEIPKLPVNGYTGPILGSPNLIVASESSADDPLGAPVRRKADRMRSYLERMEAVADYLSPEEREKLRVAQAVHGADDWSLWLPAMFPKVFRSEFGAHHAEFWDWVWAMEPGVAPPPFVAIWNRGGAKFLALDTPVPTPTGWSTVGDIEPGDEVFDEKGQVCRVVGLSPIETKPSYRLTFRGGNTVVASDDHLWTVIDRATRRVMVRHEGRVVDDWASWSHEDRPETACDIGGCRKPVRRRGPNGERWCGAHHGRWQRHGSPTAGQKPRASVQAPVRPGRATYMAEVLTTEQIVDRGLLDGDETRWCIPTVRGGFDLPDADLPVDPYVLGYWLGDGTSSSASVTVHKDDAPEFVAQMEARGETPAVHEYPGRSTFTVGLVGGLRQRLRSMDLLNNKHIPDVYLRAGTKQRRDLLAGLLDSDGTPHRNAVSFTNTRRCISSGVFDLAVSLGYRASINEERATLNGQDCGPVWRVRIVAPPSEVFYLSRKEGTPTHRKPLVDLHYLESIESAGDLPVRCLAVDSPNHLFLAGRAAIPTHNSSSAESALIALAARGVRTYAWYVSRTQGLADKHVQSIGTLLESKELAAVYPQLSQRSVNQYGSSKGWSRQQLRTASGFTIDAMGLDSAARGSRDDEKRPDIIVLDDIDSEHDGPHMLEKKIETVTKALLPSGSPDMAVIAIQNMIHGQSIFARLAGVRGAPKADFLAGRIVSGPVPAVWNMTWSERLDGDGYQITGGEPSWVGLPMDACQAIMDRLGLTAFMTECQHEEASLSGGMFDHINFSNIRVAAHEVPQLIRKGCWVDPAVTSTDQSDACGIQIDGLGVDRKYYRLWSWERRASPQEALKTAITEGMRFRCEVVGVETDQGGDTWKVVYQKVLADLLADPASEVAAMYAEGIPVPRFDQAKAGASGVSKIERIGQMLADYELGRFRHVDGACSALEAGLKRFPKYKPYDCADSAWHSWRWLAKHGGELTGRVRTRRPTGSLPQVSTPS